jgi:hypothetical protein
LFQIPIAPFTAKSWYTSINSYTFQFPANPHARIRDLLRGARRPRGGVPRRAGCRGRAAVVDLAPDSSWKAAASSRDGKGSGVLEHGVATNRACLAAVLRRRAARRGSESSRRTEDERVWRPPMAYCACCVLGRRPCVRGGRRWGQTLPLRKKEDAVLGRGRYARRRRRRRNPMLGFDGRRLGPCRPKPVFPLIGVNKGNLYRGRIGNQMMYLQSAFTNSKPIVKKIKQNPTKRSFKLSISTCKLSTSLTILANQLSMSSH